MRQTRAQAIIHVSKYGWKAKGPTPWRCHNAITPGGKTITAASKGSLIHKVERQFEEITAAKWRSRILDEY